MRVIMIGAGIGGLTLAHALRGIGIEVGLHDRDTCVDDTGGYRLHLDPVATDVLRRRLPPAVYQAVLASSAGPSSFRSFGVLDHRMRPLLAIPRDEPGDALLIGRVALRRLLAHGVDPRFGAEFTHAETHPDGTVTAHFADGSTDHGELLVGADGARSRVSTALAGRPTAQPTGAAAVAGRTPLTAAARKLLPASLREGPAFAVGPGGVAMFLSLHDPAAGTIVDPAGCHAVPAQVEEGYLLWSITTIAPGVPSPSVSVALELIAGWLPGMRELVATSDPGSVACFGFDAADPDLDLTPWPAGIVTALGDAVHAMPPTGGLGAATAIRDADLLASELAAVGAGTATVPLAVHAFEQGMARYAADAVRESLAPLRWQRMLAGAVPFRLAMAGLSLAGAGLRLHGTLRRAPSRSSPPA
jgi:salicylate hydroxylase